MGKRLYRSRSERMIWGVCGGLAEYFNIDPVIVRIIFVLLLIPGAFGLWAYIILTIVVPLESSKSTTTAEAVRENVEEIKETAVNLGNELRTTFDKEQRQKEGIRMRYGRGAWFGIILLIVGLLWLMNNIFAWFSWHYIWPVILIVIGLLIVFFRRR
jgi:phage shock protein PspC (stress-responsive transcriptional regulator)